MICGFGVDLGCLLCLIVCFCLGWLLALFGVVLFICCLSFLSGVGTDLVV